MNTILLISLFIFSISGIFLLQREIQMYQQNSYYPSRYLGWLKSNTDIYFFFTTLFFIITLTLAIIGSKYIIIFALIELLASVIRHIKLQKQSIKKLVYTNRVIRLIITASLLFLVLCLLYLFFKKLYFISAFLIIVLVHFPQILLLLSDFINKPIENSVKKYYINDAKAILNRNQNLSVIGITGSYGKTSVKFILKRILKEKYNVVATPESFNTPMGIVRTIREHLKPSTEIFIAEMGAKNPGDIKELCDICNPKTGIITAVGSQHLETFKTVETVAKTKFELADHCLKSNGNIYVNFDSSPIRDHIKSAEYKNHIISFGTGSSADCVAKNINIDLDGTNFTIEYKDHSFPVSSKLLGKHSITNILGAVALALDLGVNEREIRYAVNTLKAPPHRLELKPFINGAVLIDDAYNSNPEGCIEAVNVLGSFKDMKKVIVTPGLVELGDREYDCNYNLGAAASKQCDFIILVGKNRAVPMQNALKDKGYNENKLYIAESFKAAMEKLHEITDKNTVVLFENDLPDNYAG